MLNKLQFNNLVITNKRKIQQIKAQTIQKLVQKIRKLKGLQEKWPEDEKMKMRLRKTTEGMEQLKTLKCVDIIKKILLLNKHPSAVVTNGLSTPDEISVALLAINKTMQNLIKLFREQLNLKEGDESWKRELMRMSKRRFKIMRTEQKRERRKELKEQKVLARKRLEWLKGNNTVNERSKAHEDEIYSVGAAEESEANISASGTWKVETLPRSKTNTIKTQSKNKSTKSKNEHNINPQKAASLKAGFGSENAVRHEQLAEVRVERKPKQQLENPLKSLDSTEVKLNTPALYSEYSNAERVDANDKHSTAVMHVVDPFFITDSGENYLSTAVITREGGPSEETQPSSKKKAATASNIAPSKRPRLETRKSIKGKVQKQPVKRTIVTAQNDIKDLHPSWAAKQKFKAVITDFQGKKIKFDDDAVAKNENNECQRQYKSEIHSNANTKPDLHPSWVAKQKLKPVIADFKGKKIVFDDVKSHVDNVVNPNNPQAIPKAIDKLQKNPQESTSDLHPSWAAKQKQKPTITAFQGKKITFNVDE